MRRSPPDEGARIVPILFRSLHLLLENRAARSPNRRWRANQAAELCPCCTGPAKRVDFVNGVHRWYRDVDRVSVGDYNHGMADARYGWLDAQFHWHTLLKMAMSLVSATVNAGYWKLKPRTWTSQVLHPYSLERIPLDAKAGHSHTLA